MMSCVRLVEVLVPDRITTVEVRIPGIPGPPGAGAAGSNVTFQKIAAQAISGHRVVRAVNATEVDIASSGISSHAETILGITSNAANAGDFLNVVSHGFITEPSWAFVPDQFVFVGINGAITQVAPSGPTSLYQRVIGVAVSPDTIFVDLGPVIEII